MLERRNAEMDLLRAVLWLSVTGLCVAAGAIAAFALTGALLAHLVAATLLGVFLSVLLGCGLFALCLFSDRSGHYRAVADAARKSPGDGTARE